MKPRYRANPTVTGPAQNAAQAGYFYVSELEMPYVYPIAACFALFVLYALTGGMLGWEHGGGTIPMLILFAALGGTWRAITKMGDEK